jgi:hypothetical protein
MVLVGLRTLAVVAVVFTVIHDFAAVETFGERRVGPVQGVVEVFAPGEQLAGLIGPESRAAGVGLCEVGSGDNGVGSEFGAGGKGAVSVQRFSRAPSS